MLQCEEAKIGETPSVKIWQKPAPKRKRKETNKNLSNSEKSLEYFTVVECSAEKLSCKCKLCPDDAKPLNGSKACNLSNHLKGSHPTIYKEKVTKHIKEPLPVKRLRLLQNAVEIVGVNGRPFAYLSDSGYQAGLANKLEKLKNAGMGIDFTKNLPDVKEHLTKMAGKVRDDIQRELKGRFVCIMVDICGKNNNRPVMGVSAQFINNSKIAIRSLGMIELHESHTGVYLAKLLIDLLNEFGIEKWQVLAITTDNGANVVKMVTDFNDITSCSRAVDETNVQHIRARRQLIHDFSEISDDATDAQIMEELANPPETSEDALDILFHYQELENHETILLEVAENFIGADAIWNTTGVNCVAHTIQLAVKAALKKLDPAHTNVIELTSRVCAFLRNQSTQIAMRQIGLIYKRPRTDCKTRWGSTCMMVSNNFAYLFSFFPP